MGTMGIGPYIREDVFADVVKTAIEAAAGRVHVLIEARVKSKIDSLEHLDFDALVFPPSFYLACTGRDVLNFYKKISPFTQKSIFLYDHPYSTQVKITYEMVPGLLSAMQKRTAHIFESFFL